ncbi:lycopene beta-cyclase CrtY [Hephaestia mangrovi]|uniref:lycopene beta-cyclase CrtY n=1 Tax=Hephaestia mangrovi TaxID=2873268 RepID=UPI001CA6404D|nr:lycopene beta-cyclase CrtY [Hephaestia mangrovi]MBY8828822.1 lycopene beta-cyclase CrtY [Hephaestia mangrovi]
MATTIRCDMAIVGGGLAGGLIALAMAEMRPALDVRLIEGGAAVGGNHLWSFFASDVGPGDQWIVEPLITHRWPRYQVAFPGHARVIDTGYRSIDSRRLDAVCRGVLGARLMLGRKALAASPTAVVLDDGTRIEATGVIDARGTGDLSLLELGWQKFLGQELALAAPADDPPPMVMDATVAQHDGYRFVYALPFAATRMFVEDTYYSDGRTLDHAVLRERIAAYAAARGWQVAAVAREEAGALPVALDGDFAGYWHSGGRHVAKAGMRAGLFHPTTGYSLPDAVRTAALIARQRDYSGAALHDLLHDFAAKAWKERRFYRMLDRMLFRAAEPDERYRILERFYRLDSRLIGRFYAARSSYRDQARILAGKPPVPITRAIRAIVRRPA